VGDSEIKLSGQHSGLKMQYIDEQRYLSQLDRTLKIACCLISLEKTSIEVVTEEGTITNCQWLDSVSAAP
jgi:hypothetical protein